ncbi:L,D-transpeptidase [Streptomyces sp. MS19]|uniref:L,D-transpeptidase n=1 Tax=Streptomyces sp. MS19 TaxID=3385972 RepID=UPI0039A09E4F
MARPSSGSGSGLFVTALTAAALAVVAFFAFQASAADDRPSAAAEPSAPAASEGDSDGAGGAGGGGEGEGAEEPSDPALPEESGTGRRVVYALAQQRVWLVDVAADGSGEEVVSTFEVFPSPVSPEPGEYAVSSRNPQGTGSDGVPMEHAVIFHADAEGVVFGFSAATDGSVPDPESTQRTGAVRQSRADGDTMWEFAEQGTAVVVVA